MSASPITKTAFLFFILLGIIVGTFALTTWRYEYGNNRLRFQLTSHAGEILKQSDLAGHYLLVSFGFTSCLDVCPTQTHKMSQVMSELDVTGHGNQVYPVFITVDPERDTPQKLAQYLAHFDQRFIGLTGSRAALKGVADTFKTLLEPLATNRDAGYQIAHSSLTYIVDPFGRIVEYLPAKASTQMIANKLRELI